MTMTGKFHVGRYVCEMSWSPGSGVRCEWSPDVPPPKSFNQHLMSQYRAGRDAFLQEEASTIGGNILLLEAER
jgi:hypothetical protein